MSARKTAPTALLLLAIAIVLVALFARTTPEPTYQGRPLSAWLQQYGNTRRTAYYPSETNAARQMAEAREAIRTIGTNGLPLLLKWINYEPPFWVAKLPGHAPLWVVQTADSVYGDFAKELRTSDAALSFEALGTNADGAIPDLVIIGTNFGRPFASAMARSALSTLGAEALPALWSMRSNSPLGQQTRIAEEIAINIQNTPTTTNSIPYLLLAVTDPSLTVRQAATNALRRIAPDLLTNNPAQ